MVFIVCWVVWYRCSNSTIINSDQVGEYLTIEERIAVIKLATMWDFSAIRQCSIDILRPMLFPDPARRFVLARQYGITSWLIPALNDLARREQPLTQTDVDTMGLEDVLKLAQEQHNYCSQCQGYVPKPRAHFNFAPAIRTIFGL